MAKQPASFLKRKKNAHKGDFGRILIIAGSRGMSGAPGLTGMAALRSGAGLVTLAVPDAIYPIAARQNLELMVRPFASAAGAFALRAYTPISKSLAGQDVLAIGPGLSRRTAVTKLVHQLILNSKIPAVIDADALNAFENRPQLFLRAQAPLFLTPHEKEFERIFGTLKPGKATLSERKEAARKAAENFGVHIILKGHKTVVAAPGGKLFVNQTGNPGMATAGSGDILTGILAGLLGRKKDFFETACLAVYAHGLAGDFAAAKKSRTALIAGDLLEYLPAVFKKLEK